MGLRYSVKGLLFDHAFTAVQTVELRIGAADNARAQRVDATSSSPS